jgi:hypothetical protein
MIPIVRRTNKDWRVVVVLLAFGCTPFVAIKPSTPTDGVGVTFCGSSATSPESVMKSLEPPTNVPPEVGGSAGLPEQKELRVCLKLENRGDKPARLTRSRVRLRCPHETDSWEYDRDDEEVIAHPGETRELHIAFRYSPLPAGEDVQLLFEGALTVGGRPAKIAPMVLRKQ